MSDEIFFLCMAGLFIICMGGLIVAHYLAE